MDPVNTGFDMNALGMNYLDRIIPRFHMRTVYMEEKSEEAGRAVYEDKEYVEFITPGDRRSVPCLRVIQRYITQWPKQYEAFKAGVEYIGEGRPLAEWPAMPGSMTKTLNAINIHTVEQFAESSSDTVAKLGPGYAKMQDMAVRFISENDTKQDQIDILKNENESLIDRINALEQSVVQKLGGPKKKAVKAKPKPKPQPPVKKVTDEKDASRDSE